MDNWNIYQYNIQRAIRTNNIKMGAADIPDFTTDDISPVIVIGSDESRIFNHGASTVDEKLYRVFESSETNSDNEHDKYGANEFESDEIRDRCGALSNNSDNSSNTDSEESYEYQNILDIDSDSDIDPAVEENHRSFINDLSKLHTTELDITDAFL